MERRRFLRDGAAFCAGQLFLRGSAAQTQPPTAMSPVRPAIDPAELAARAAHAAGEPSLAELCIRLGYSGTDVSVKAETVAPQLRKAGPGMVRVYPLAAYGPNKECTVGWYLEEKPDKRNLLWKIDGRNDKQDNPPTQSKGRIAFDPEEKPFGLYLTTQGFRDEILYTDDARNAALARFGSAPNHRARFYAAISSNGTALPNTYLVGWDYTALGGFQDLLMVVENTLPA